MQKKKKNDTDEALETELINYFEALPNRKKFLSRLDKLKQTLLLIWTAAKYLIDLVSLDLLSNTNSAGNYYKLFESWNQAPLQRK